MTEQRSSTGTDELPPCPLCKGNNITTGVFYAEGSSAREGAVRCATCGCRAPLAAWLLANRGAAQPNPDPFPFRGTDPALFNAARIIDPSIGLSTTPESIREEALRKARAIARAFGDGYASRDSVIEECAKVAEAQKQQFLSTQYAANQPFGSICERFACDEVAAAIRALSIPSTTRATPICETCGGAGEIDERLGGIATSGIVPCPDCAISSTNRSGEA